MSQRVKKPGRSEESQGKRRRRRPSGGSDADPDEDVDGNSRSGSNSGGGNGSLSGMWTPRHLNDLKVSSIYNRNSAEAPAELYRKDLISAMKLADSEPLTPEEFWLITDPWKQEWEKGVQVPVNPESLPEPEVVVISPVADRSHDFRLPKKKYVRVTHDDFFNPDYHQLVSTAARAEKVCSYDLDDVDAAWLGCCNSDRGMQTLPIISEFLMEQVIEELELQCWEQVQTILKSQEGLGIEYDENVICDVCRSPESEEGNEMVFCDSCNICVHQACYGITTIPSGSWLCRTCTLGIRPSCVLCPNVGGAMKATRSGHKWAHVACAIWILEVSFGSVEKMEPITKISSIPQSRWSLVCVLCKEKVGACIQCSVKSCKTAYHVTCAFKNGLEMKPIIVDENAEDGIKLRSYCQKHSVNTKKDKSANSGSEEDIEKKKERAMTAEERNLARAEKLQQIEAEFYKYVRLKDVSQNLAVDMDIVNLIYNYWKLKRKSLNNRPLVPPRPETTQLLTQQQEQDLEQMKMFVQLRQDLERVRNLCYMVSRREKLSRTFFRLREQTFQKQVALLGDLESLPPAEKSAILDANHGPAIYDKCYSHAGVTCNYKDYDALVNLIVGLDKKDIVNGVMNSVKGTKGRGKSGDNPYKKTFVNGARRRNILGESCSSVSESESILSNAEDGQKHTTKSSDSTGRKPLSYLFDTDSSNDESGVIMSTGRKNSSIKTIPAKGRGLKQMEKMLDKSSTSDSELDLPPVSTPVNNNNNNTTTITTTNSNNNNNKSVGKRGKRENIQIYSDTESEKSIKPTITTANNLVATKGALKEFTGKKNKEKLNNTKNNIIDTTTVPVRRGRGKGKATTTTTTTTTTPTGKRKKAGFDPTELIVPQREAAKKASESIRTVKSRGKDQSGGQDENPPTPEPTLPSTTKDSSPLTPTTNSNLNKESKMNKSKESIVITDFDEESEEQQSRGTTTTSSSKNKKNLEKKKVGGVGKKNLQKGGKNTNNNMISTTTTTKGMEPVKTEYDFDDENSSSGITKLEESSGEGNPKSVSYVPQRQAAKKAAEHIRSGLSNIVAARLIIEDEMEASRKKAKGEKGSNKKGVETSSTSKSSSKSSGKKPSLTELFDELRQNNMKDDDDNEEEEEGEEEQQRLKLEQQDDKGDQQNASGEEDVGVSSKKVTQKERNLSKGGDVSRTSAMRGGKKEKLSAATSSAAKASSNSKEVRKDTDWPFLELGSQSVCRRSSRERSSSSSSSSGSSSSSASSTSRSSSSSRSSSPESASPERNVTTKSSSSTPVIPTTPIKSLTQSSPICASPGRRLKTPEGDSTERTPSRVGTKTPKRKEPGPVKGSGGSRSKKSGSRRSSVTVEESPVITISPESTSPTRRTSSSTTTTTTIGRQSDTITPTTKENITPVSRNNKRQRKLSTGGNDGPTRTNSNNNKNNKAATTTTSPQSRRLSSSPTKTKCPQEKGKRRTRESKISKNDENQQSQSEAIPISTTNTTTTSGSNKTRASPKALKKFELDLSSDSEPDSNSSSNNKNASKINTTTTTNTRNKSKSPKSSNITPTTTTTTASTNDTVKHKPMPKTKKKQLGLLSESEENSDVDEKENSCIPPPTPSSPKKECSTTNSSSSSPKKVGSGSAHKSSVPAGNITTTNTNVMSPLIPSSENKEKTEQYSNSILSDSEPPESKRARLDTSLTSSSITNKTTLLPPDASSILIDSISELTSTQSSSSNTNTSITLNTASTTTTSGITNASAAVLMKSIFSPPGSGRGDSEMLDFDSDLYDLARSVTDEVYSQHGDGEEGGSGSLSFSFSKGFLSGEDNKEDSAMATLNLVEKLRLQHARKSGTNHRPSTESLSDIGDSALDGDGQIVKSPISSSTIEKDELISNTSTSSSNNNNNTQLISNKQGQDSCSSSNNNNNNSFFEETSRSKTPVSVITSESPSRTKSIQGDERWVPPSTDQVLLATNNNNNNNNRNNSTAIPQQPPSKNQVQVPPQPSPSSHHSISNNKSIDSSIISNNMNILHSRTSSKDNIMEEDAFTQQQQQQQLLHHQLQNQNQIENMKQELLNSSVSTPEFNNFMHNENNLFIPSSNSTINQQQQHYDGGQYSQSSNVTTNTSSSSCGVAVSSNSIMSPSLIGNMSQINSNNNINNPHTPFLYPNEFFPPAQSINSTTTGIPKTSPSLTTTPTSFSPNTFPPHFLSQQQQQQLLGQQQPPQISPLGNSPSSMIPSSLSSPISSSGHSQKSQQRRPSDIGIDSNNSNKGGLAIPSSIVAANTMPPLSKPPLSSPSILLAASNAVKIIESVVNNHSGNQLQKQPSLLSNQTSSSSSSSTTTTTTTSFISTSKQQQQINVLNSFTESSSPSGKSPIPNMQQQKGLDSSDFSAVLSTKTENIITPKYHHHTPRHDHSVVPVSNSNNTSINNISNTNTISPKGRGKRPSTPRVKTEKMVVVEEVSPPIIITNNNSTVTTTTTIPTTGKGKGRGGARGDKNTSPSRGGHHNNMPTNRRTGGGRGRGRGKNSLVGIRKDLAGTVYDINFDEFEENTEEKLDLKSLRERRKSSDVFSEVKKSESSNTNASPVPHFEKNSPRFRNNFDPHHNQLQQLHHHHQQQQHRQQGGAAVESINNNNNNTTNTSSSNNNNGCSSTNTRNIDKMLPIIQAPLPGPVDMRTYNASMTTETSAISNDVLGSFSQQHGKDPTESSSLFKASSVNTGMNDLEVLDKTIDALASSSNITVKSLTTSSNLLSTSTTNSTTSTTNQISSIQQQQQQMMDNQQFQQQQQQHKNTPSLRDSVMGGGDSNLSKDLMDTLMPTASILSSGDSSSRNQLKVKIKGPFLDANYSSNSIPPPHHHHHHHVVAAAGMANFPPPIHPSEPSYHHSMMNVVNPSMINNTSNLRRMRKKELLRQYWTQDMNMDGSTFNPPPPPYSMGHHHQMISTNPSSNHPLNRSVIPNLTIPKAVASFSHTIIPTKDDYRMDNNIDDPMNQQFSSVPLPPPGKETKKRRNRGGSREVAALGILTEQSSGPRERRRDRTATNSLNTPNIVSEPNNSRKRGRTSSNKPSNKPFIPPTLVESHEENSTTVGGDNSAGNNGSANNQSTATTTIIKPNATSIVTAVSHPTPKLKIKFGSEQTPSVSTVNSNSMNSNNQLSDSDKETPNKKAKGRPPKKRGLNTAEIPAPPSMEEYKRQSMKYAEEVMQSYASDKRRHKKHKSKKRSGASETDDSRSKSPELVADLSAGSKLILRIKSRTNPSTNSQQASNDESSNFGIESSKSSSNSKVNDGNPKIATTKGLSNNVDLSEPSSLSKTNGPTTSSLMNNSGKNESAVRTLSDTNLNKNISRIDGDLVEHDSGFTASSNESHQSVVGVGASTSTFSGSLLNTDKNINTKPESSVPMTSSSGNTNNYNNNNNNNNSSSKVDQSYTSKITTASSSNNTSSFDSESGKSNNIDTLASNSVSEGNDSKSIEKIKPIKLKINIKKKNINIPIKIIN